MITIKKNNILHFAAGAAMCAFLLANSAEPSVPENVFCVEANAAAKITAENVSAPEGDFSLGRSFGFGGVIKQTRMNFILQRYTAAYIDRTEKVRLFTAKIPPILRNMTLKQSLTKLLHSMNFRKESIPT